MLELSNAQIGAWVSSFLLPMFRIASLLMVMPIIGTQLVPTRVRLYLALAITVVIVPTLPPMPEVDALNLRSLLLIGQEVLIGAMFGFMLQLFFHVYTVIGQILSIQMGIGLAAMVDPANGISVPVLGQLLTMLTTLLFLAMNGHLVVFEVIAESFVTLPVGSGMLVGHYWELVGKLSWVLGAGLLISLPVVTALLVVNLAFGVMTRAAPQLNIFSVGFPLTLTFGLVVVWIGMADTLNQYQNLSSVALAMLRDLAQAR